MRGVIIKGIAGFYYVSSEGKIFECKARGKFRLDEIKPLPGDIVEFEQEGDTLKGYMLEILPRKNELVRPCIANVDQFVLVMSAESPKPDFLLSDKLIIQSIKNNVVPVICLNKCDISEDDIIEQINNDYSGLNYKLVLTSAKTKQGLAELEALLKDKISCFAGQSAVGKSSILNALCGSFKLETGTLSRKTARGKHTTRASQLLVLPNNAFVMDTPGFSLIDIAQDIAPEELQNYYTEFWPYRTCFFQDCLHINEPKCGVKKAVEKNKISQRRYKRYTLLTEEIQENIRRKYD